MKRYCTPLPHSAWRAGGLAALILALAAPIAWAEEPEDITAADVKRIESQAGPGVPEPPRVEQTKTGQASREADGTVTTTSSVKTESVTPARLQSQRVVDSQGASVATVERVIEDPKSGKVRYLVISDLEKKYIIPYEVFTVANKDADLTLILNVESSRLKGAPIFQETRLIEYTTQTTAEPIYAYWSTTWQESRH